jgi:hypothetical protein
MGATKPKDDAGMIAGYSVRRGEDDPRRSWSGQVI